MTTKEFEEMFNQKFSIDVDNTFDNAISTELAEDDEDGECIDKVQKESSLDLSFGFSSNDNINNHSKSNNSFRLSFMGESSEVEDDLYVGNEDFDSQFNLSANGDDGLDVAEDYGEAEYIDDDDEDGECIDIVENE